MALSLPGLFNFTDGRASATAQRNNQAIADGNEALSFVQQLNALNTSLNTNDNLQFRNEFAQQDPGTSILDRFSNIASSTQNPFLLNQAVTQQQSLAPLLALNAVQNPFFAAQQGLPNTLQGNLNQGLLGFQPILDQARNQEIQRLLTVNNPQLSAAQFGDQAAQTNAVALLNQQLEEERARSAQFLRQRDAAFNNTLRNTQTATAQPANTAAPQLPATQSFGLTRGVADPAANPAPLPATR